MTQWRFLTDAGGAVTPRPYVTTSGLAIAPDGYFPIIYRSDAVRSAKNCWSLPSGLHEIGLTLFEQLTIELREELNLEVDHERGVRVPPYPTCVYENIAHVDCYHWVIAVMVVPVKTLETLTNREPEKHPEIRRVHYTDILSAEFLGLPWAPGLGPALSFHANSLFTAASGLMKPS